MKKKKRKKNKKGHCYQLKKQFKKQVKKAIINEVLFISKKDIDDKTNCIPLLSKKDNLFIESNDMQDAMLNTTKVFNDILVTNGYISAAILLMDLIKHFKSNLSKDSYIYPALFCFRQYLELTMKKSILYYRNWNTKSYEGESNFKTHNLDDLWKKLKKHITPIDLEVEAIEQLIHELNEIDNDGVTFRYDYELNHLVRNKDQKALNELIDVNVLRIRMLQLYRFFDGIDDEARFFYDNNKK